MVKSVVVSVKSTQTGADQDVQSMELVAIGQARQKEREWYVQYEETSLSGMEGTRTTLKVLPERLVVLRHGSVESKQHFETGKAYSFLYQSPYGSLDMAVVTQNLQVTQIFEQDLPLTVELAYDLILEGQWQSYNTLTIVIQEELKRGHERTVDAGFG